DDGVVRRRDARRAAERIDAQPRVVGDRRRVGGARRVARLRERVLDEGRMRLVGLGDAELALRDELDRQRREERGELGELGAVVRREDEPHVALASGAASAARCIATSSPMPLVASASSASISRRENVAPSAVPCSSTKPPAPVMTTFMSVSQAASSTYSRSRSGVPPTMPTETAATKSWIGERSIRPCASSHETESWAATNAPVIAAVRVPPSACRTSQSSAIVRSPSTARSNTQRSDRPISHWISCVRPLCLPRAASRSLLVCVDRGSIPYSAVTQPSPLPRLCGGTFSSTDAVHRTRVSPNATSTDPSAWRVKPLAIDTGLSASCARPNERLKVIPDCRRHPEGRRRCPPLPLGGRGAKLGREQPWRASKRSEQHTKGVQPFLCCELRLIASLISLMDRSISASSSSSGETSLPSTLAWIVDANTASPSAAVWMPPSWLSPSTPSNSTASTETLSHFGPPLRSACSTSSGTESDSGSDESCSAISLSLTVPQR